jgi:hypothetical protein
MEEELALLGLRFTDMEYAVAGCWVRIPNYPMAADWNRTVTDVAFQIHASHPGTPPYGIYVPAGLLFRGTRPNNYTEPANNQPPFPGSWGIFSWTLDDGAWRPTADLVRGSNLLNWVLGFAVRFREGV